MKKYIHFIPALILAATLPYKFTNNEAPYLVEFFSGLTGGYGHEVMTFIGLQELVIVIGLLVGSTRKFAAFGAVMMMLGAISTHIWLQEFDLILAQAFVVLFTSGYLIKNDL